MLQNSAVLKKGRIMYLELGWPLLALEEFNAKKFFTVC